MPFLELTLRCRQQEHPRYESALDAKLENKFDELTRHGFITLIDDAHSCPYFLNSQSVYEPPVYDTDSANRIARLHTQLENIVAASRFAINLMSLWQERSSLFNTREDKARFLLKWLERYYHNDDNAPDELKALRPLREYYLNLEEIPDKPGAYKAVLYIRPTYRLEDTLIAMRLVVYLPESPTG
jgi:type VI secretion system protein ImpC